MGGEIKALATADPVARRPQQLRGVGSMTATVLLATIGDESQFKYGRQMAASLGPTSWPNSWGSKARLLGISKRGDTYVRTQLVHGGRAVLQMARRRDDPLSRWAVRIANNRHPNVAAVAMANKTSRIAWAMLCNGADYEPALATH